MNTPVDELQAERLREEQPQDDRERERAEARAALSRLCAMPSDHPEHDALREHVIGEYMSYARFVARRFRQRGEPAQDLDQVAYLGLVKAVDNFDPDYGTTFLTYATPIISGEIKRHFRDTTWDLHVPRRMQELSAAVRGAQEELTQRLGTAPSAEDVAFFLDLPLDEVVDAYEAVAAYHTASLDTPVALADGDGATLGDLLGGEDPGIDLVVDREALKPLLEQLSGREKRILLMRFFRNMSQAEIGAELGVSQMQVSRLLSQILGRLRQRLGVPG
ncbi:SigB/SigF/SigG family RNA polymerase sigma factor [Catenulispora subtropica]|uniref:RNA polymerase, sigma 28 subunit, Sig B/F/G subfamily n=1 Tax=Catenulispora subtropica TaxID=450798 RepID=A0ABP5DY44_9ACTN